VKQSKDNVNEIQMRQLSLTVAAALTLAASSGPSQARYPYYGFNYYNPCAAAYV